MVVVELYEIITIAFVIIFVAVAIWYIVPTLVKKPVTGAESLVGARGTVYSETLSPSGEVSVQGVIWRARPANPNATLLLRGDEVIVNRVDDITLIVSRAAS